MADYIGIKGSDIPAVASDPSNPVLGQVWYNTTSNTMKGYATSLPAVAWTSASGTQLKRSNYGGTGTQQAALAYLGEGPYASKNITEEYNGTSWASGNACLVARQACMGGLGTQTAALAVVGTDNPPGLAIVESYDGTSWSEINDIINARYEGAGAGTQTAAIIAGGINPPPASKLCEVYDGTSWSEQGDINNGPAGRHNCQGAGTSTAAIIAGGNAPGYANFDYTEIWDGSTWTETADLNTSRTNMGGATAGTSTNYMIMCGSVPPPSSQYTEVWDGTSWTEVADTTTARKQCQGAGTTGAALVGSSNDTPGQICEEWNAGAAVQTFTSS